MPKFLYPNGIATETGAYIVVQVVRDDGSLIDGNLFADYRMKPEPEGFGTDWRAISLCYRPSGDVVYAAGENGEIVRIAETGNVEEFIAPAENGPAVQGPIREIRLIGDDLYATGMGRQVYRRTGEGHWDHFDTGVLDSSDRATVGLTSITGDGQGFLIAVGYQGEIWEFDGAWRQVDSPTNLLLNRVLRHEGKYYVAGQVGTLLCREAEGWRIVDAPDFQKDVWDLASFRGNLYLGTSEGLFWTSDGEEIKPVDPAGFTRQVHCAKLSAGADRLWCFGAEIVSTTEDGTLWREEAIL